MRKGFALFLEEVIRWGRKGKRMGEREVVQNAKKSHIWHNYKVMPANFLSHMQCKYTFEILHCKAEHQIVRIVLQFIIS